MSIRQRRTSIRARRMNIPPKRTKSHLKRLLPTNKAC
jgi:hypothetical protein